MHRSQRPEYQDPGICFSSLLPLQVDAITTFEITCSPETLLTPVNVHAFRVMAFDAAHIRESLTVSLLQDSILPRRATLLRLFSTRRLHLPFPSKVGPAE